ncbi:MAG: flagellar biosynthesis anti-sigma factor FlgM [Planctomycetota bacterium]
MNRVSNDVFESGVFLMEPESAEAKKWLKQLRDMPDVRLKKIMRIRAEIAKGTYETGAKWRIALDRLLQEMGE